MPIHGRAGEHHDADEHRDHAARDEQHVERHDVGHDHLGRRDRCRSDHSARPRGRTAPHGRGLRAETLALIVLMLKGYRPLARRYAAAGGEIDLIVARGDTIAFVEVKARAALDQRDRRARRRRP